MDTNSSLQLVRDINFGSNSAFPLGANLIVFNDRLFFNADDGVQGEELWSSDGTSEGTQLVADIYEGSSGSTPLFLTEFNNKLFFAAADGVSGFELWSSDGTSEGTQILKDINLTEGEGATPQDLITFRDKIFFRADNGSSGQELWLSDGTAEGTQLIRDIYPGVTTVAIQQGSINIDTVNNSFPDNFSIFNDRLFFTATDASRGKELWRVSDNLDGTQLVKDIYPGVTTVTLNEGEENENTVNTINNSSPANFIVFDNNLFFTANNGDNINENGDPDGNGVELWKSDGTAEGTQLFKDIYPGITTTEFTTEKDDKNNTKIPGENSTVNSSFPANFVVFDNNLFFTANDGVNGVELWKSDGTPEGTQLVKDINPGSGNSFPSELTIFDDQLFFSADDGNNGRELWVSNGSSGGTQLVADINPGVHNSSPKDFIILGESLFFTADNGSNGIELWKFSGNIIPSDNSDPVALDDNFTTNEDTEFTTSNVLLNDSDPNGDSLTLVNINTTNTLGLVTNNNDGTFEYNPNGAFADLVAGETAIDRFSYTISDGNGGTDTATVTIDVTGLDEPNEPNEINGTDNDDTLSGTGEADKISGLAGSDRLLGQDGDDTILGAAGNDFINGGNGKDSVLGGNGNDNLRGGNGNDILEGQSGDDSLFGNTGNDTLKGGNNNDLIRGDRGDDSLVGANGNDTLEGGNENDILDGGSGDDILDGGSGNDTISGRLGDDLLRGGNNNDRLEGNVGNDTLFGESGSDRLFGNGNNDSLNGGDGADTLSGGSGQDSLRGGLGDDTLRGNGGDDVFILSVEEGTDTIGDFTLGQDKIGLSDGLNFNQLILSGNDIIFGTEVLAKLNFNTANLGEIDFREIV